jgi:CRISPR/Cas system CMR-associated protein Cmr3 (group 5 of RAMP superfamily)
MVLINKSRQIVHFLTNSFDLTSQDLDASSKFYLLGPNQIKIRKKIIKISKKTTFSFNRFILQTPTSQ